MNEGCTHLVIGASGQVGFNIFSNLKMKSYNVVGTYYKHKLLDYELEYCDITNIDGIRRLIERLSPKIIYLTAANSNVEYVEDNPIESFEINVKSVYNIIKICKDNNIKLVFISSEYVFDGFNGPYKEIDGPNPINVYGLHKLIVEHQILQHLVDYIIIRSTVIYGKEFQKKNFVYGIIDRLIKDISIDVPVDQISSPTYAFNLSEIALDLVAKDQVGIFNICGTDIMSRYDFSLCVAEVFGLNKNLLKPVITNSLDQRAKRPLNAGLYVTKIASVTDIKINSAMEGLTRFKQEII